MSHSRAELRPRRQENPPWGLLGDPGDPCLDENRKLSVIRANKARTAITRLLSESGRAVVGSPGTGGRTRQRFGVCTEFTPRTLHRGQSASSAGPAEGLIERRGL